MMLKNAIHIGDALTTLQKFPSESVHCIVTSPPYFALRDYGVPGQLGLEQSPDEYLDKLVAIFREARRVLRHDGTCWVNIGDSYCGGGGYSPNAPSNQYSRAGQRGSAVYGIGMGIPPGNGYKPKDLMLIPFRLALALQADGYWVRQTNIWHKSNPMPASVTDRTTTDFEYVFHLSKAAHYWYDADAIREPTKEDDMRVRPFRNGTHDTMRRDNGNVYRGQTTRNKRSVWTIPSEPFSDAHFATFPQALPELCIAAGCPATCCAKCGAGYVRVVEKQFVPQPDVSAARNAYRGKQQYGDKFTDMPRGTNKINTLGFKPSCTCVLDDKPETMPGVVLDMFGGAGTTALAAKHLGRDYVLIELNPRYVEMAQKRIRNYDPLQPTEFKDGSKQLSLFGEAV